MKKFQLIGLSIGAIFLMHACYLKGETYQENESILPDQQKQTEFWDTIQSKDKLSNIIMYSNINKKERYIAEQKCSIGINSVDTKEREIDKGLIIFPCKIKRKKNFEIAKNKIINVVSMKLDMDVYEKYDYVFTEFIIYEIHTFASNAGIFTSSEIKSIPNEIKWNPELNYRNYGRKNCDFNKYLFEKALLFCKINQLKLKKMDNSSYMSLYYALKNLKN